MVKLPKKFMVGDKVFAKVRGYPPWPAKIEKVMDANTKNARYKVYFYGTGETAFCKVDEMFDYTENKAKFNKPMKRKMYNDGLRQLEKELNSEKLLASVNESETKGGVNVSEKNDDVALDSMAATSSDTESKLVIDEGEPKKAGKRKATLSAQNTPDVPEVKKRRVGRPPASEKKQEVVKQETDVDSQGEESSEKEMVSRSGRKIKPKRFSDFSNSGDTSKTEHTGRGKMKVKSEELNENQGSIVGVPKKRGALEKKMNNVNTSLNKSNTSSSSSSEIPNRLLARTFAGEYVGIKLNMDRPETFENDKARTQWDWSMARNAMKLKTRLESGEILPEQVKDSLDFNIHVPEEEKRMHAKDTTISFQQKYKIKWLRTEAELLQLDAQIKSNLCLDRANTDKCLEAMDIMLNLSLDPLMLKKHPHIVETVKRLRRYIGNLADWKLSEEEETSFKQKAEQIRQKAEHIYNKFKAMFTIPEGQSFWQSFSDEVVHFKELTKDMSEEKVYSLMSDPACSDAVITLDTLADDSSNQTDADTGTEEGTECTFNSSAMSMNSGTK